MKCSFYETDITPSLGSIIPGGFGARYATEVLDPLFARAFVARNDSTALAVVSIDACGITSDITERIRKRTAEMIPVSPENIMVVATHAHGAGPTLNWGEEIVTDEHYLKCLVERASDAIISAYNSAADSELVTGKEEVNNISFIRVYRMKDGSLKTNPGVALLDKIDKPCSTIDPELFVLAVRQENKLIGAVANFATHPATIATEQITGDYISILSNEMKKIYGNHFVTVFINGACGNINHVNWYDEKTFKNRYDVYKNVGKTLALAASKAIENGSVMNDTTLKAVSSSVSVKFRKPTKEQLLWAKDHFDSLGDELIESTPSKLDYTNTFFALQIFLIQADKRTRRNIDLQLFRIGSCHIFGNPCQIFVEYGKKIKAACGDFCFISAFANDYCGYVPTPECMKPGVYEATLAPTSALEPATGDIIADKLIEMHSELN